MSCDVVHQQGAKVGLAIDDHDLDAHWIAVAGWGPLVQVTGCGPLVQVTGWGPLVRVAGWGPLLRYRALNSGRTGAPLRSDSGETFAPGFAFLLGRIVSALFEFIEVLVRDITSNIFAGEAGGIKFGNPRIVMADRAYQPVQVLVNESICADQFLHLFHGSSVRDEFRCGRHVDAVDVRVTHRWGRGRKVDIFSAVGS